eukprot:13900064-Alexandrium_andersonii.AAC.1
MRSRVRPTSLRIGSAASTLGRASARRSASARRIASAQSGASRPCSWARRSGSQASRTWQAQARATRPPRRRKSAC